MLIKFSVENFKTFNDLSELSLIQSAKITENKNHVSNVKDVNLLKYASIYGANSAGKSSLIDAILFFKNTVIQGLSPATRNMYCRLKKENRNKPSSFELQFSFGNKIYAYGFSALLYEQKIQSEWLYELLTKGKSKAIFEYDLNNDIDIKQVRNYGISDNEVNRFKVYANDFKKYDKYLFLTEMNRNKIIDGKSKMSVFNKVFFYIFNNIVALKPDTGMISNNWFSDKTYNSINNIMKSLDTGISEIEFRKISLEELSNRLPLEVYNNLRISINEALTEPQRMMGNITMNNGELIISTVKDNTYKIYLVKNKHKNSEDEFDFEEESDGTKRIFWLLNLLINEAEDMVYFVDEIDRSLHPKLTEKFIKLFDEYHSNSKIQLILTTHESSIMNLDLFRRDEIWFIDKGEDNNSKLYSLDSFKERYDKKIEKAYLEGRYGAIPVFEEFNLSEED